jgi:hypothetical protein
VQERALVSLAAPVEECAPILPGPGVLPALPFPRILDFPAGAEIVHGAARSQSAGQREGCGPGRLRRQGDPGPAAEQTGDFILNKLGAPRDNYVSATSCYPRAGGLKNDAAPGRAVPPAPFRRRIPQVGI